MTTLPLEIDRESPATAKPSIIFFEQLEHIQFWNRHITARPQWRIVRGHLRQNSFQIFRIIYEFRSSVFFHSFAYSSSISFPTACESGRAFGLLTYSLHASATNSRIGFLLLLSHAYLDNCSVISSFVSLIYIDTIFELSEICKRSSNWWLISWSSIALGVSVPTGWYLSFISSRTDFATSLYFPCALLMEYHSLQDFLLQIEHIHSFLP